MSFLYIYFRGRIYKIGSNLYEIPHALIQKFQTWNRNFPENASKDTDEIVVRALLLILVSRYELAQFHIEADTLKFIQGNCIEMNTS